MNLADKLTFESRGARGSIPDDWRWTCANERRVGADGAPNWTLNIQEL